MIIDCAPENMRWVPWAKQKLAELSRLRAQLSLPKLSRAYYPAAGIQVWVSARVGRDAIRISGGAQFEFLVSEHDVTGSRPVNILHGVRRPTPGAPLEPFEITRSNIVLPVPSAFTDSPAFSTFEDFEHGNSVQNVFDPRDIHRGKGSLPNVVVKKGPEDLSVPRDLVGSNYIRAVGGENMFGEQQLDLKVSRIRQALTSAFSVDDFIARAKLVFPKGAPPDWSYSIYTPGIPVAGSDYQRVRTALVSETRFVAIARPIDGIFSLPGVTNWQDVHGAFYAEVYDVAWAADGTPSLTLLTTVKTDELWPTNAPPATLRGERYIRREIIGDGPDVFHFRTPIGPVGLANPEQQVKFTFSDVGDSLSRSGTLTGPMVPTPFNCPIVGAGVIGAGSRLPATIFFADNFLHPYGHGALEGSGYPWPACPYVVAANVGGHQYYWVNSTSVFSAPEPSGFNPGVVVSPHEVIYRRILIRDGVMVMNTADSRVYTSTEDPFDPSPPASPSWDRTDPVYIYVPTDAVEVDGVVWFCGERIEQVFDAFDSSRRLTHKACPAMWTSDMSEVRAYPAYERVSASTGPFGASQHRDVIGSWYTFIRYRGVQYFVFSVFSSATPALDGAYVVGLDAPSEAPVLLPAGSNRANRTVPWPSL